MTKKKDTVLDSFFGDVPETNSKYYPVERKSQNQLRKEFSKSIENFVTTLTRPIIVDRNWGTTLTKEQKGIIEIERLKQVMINKGAEVKEATDYEAMLFLSQASLNAPLRHQWTKIYMYLFKKFYPNKSDFIDEHDAKLNEYELRELETLRERLYKASIKAK